MNFSRWCWQSAGVTAVAALLILSASSSAQDKGQKDSKKGKGAAKPDVIQIDLSKLPPDLAKQLRELTKETAKKAPARSDDGINNDRDDGQKGQHDDGEKEGKVKPKAKGEDDARGEGKREDDERESKGKPAKGDSKAKTPEQGFQGEQTGQHEDGKAEPKTKGKGEKKGKEAGQQPTQPTPGGAATAKRLAELEQRLDELIRDLAALRKAMSKK
jgi:hypothetical protein